MTQSVAISAWLLLLMGALGPAWRWFIARSANQVIDELSTRLRIGIRPWQRTRRQALIDRLITDPKVQAAAEQHARDHGISDPAASRMVERYAREIVPAFNAYFYFRGNCFRAALHDFFIRAKRAVGGYRDRSKRSADSGRLHHRDKH